jgi:hypothetical protein
LPSSYVAGEGVSAGPRLRRDRTAGAMRYGGRRPVRTESNYYIPLGDGEIFREGYGTVCSVAVVSLARQVTALFPGRRRPSATNDLLWARRAWPACRGGGGEGWGGSAIRMSPAAAGGYLAAPA